MQTLSSGMAHTPDRGGKELLLQSIDTTAHNTHTEPRWEPSPNPVDDEFLIYKPPPSSVDDEILIYKPPPSSVDDEILIYKNPPISVDYEILTYKPTPAR